MSIYTSTSDVCTLDSNILDQDNDICKVCDEYIDDCCCKFCSFCNTKVVSDIWCSVCERCDEHCPCSYCNACDRRHDRFIDFCSDCDSCLEYCDCDNDESSSTVEFFQLPLTFHKARPTEFLRNTSRRFISAEIEVADTSFGYNISKTVSDWSGSIVSDGSLPDGGFEINTAPAQGDKFIKQIEDICSALREDGAEVSSACGLHIHIDAKDYTYYDLRRLILLYERLELALFEMMPYSRRESHYCQPCGKLYADAIRERIAFLKMHAITS
jgi:hypothetical protein